MKRAMLILIAAIVFASCVQETHKKEVTFWVDMNGVEDVRSVGIRGNFLPDQWKKTVPMTDEDNDGIYQITFTEKTAVYGIEFKFVKNDNEFELPGKNNREIVFEYRPETITYSATFNKTNNTKIHRK